MTENLIYENGSEWTKWDLHVHTPFSIYQNFDGSEQDKWEEYIQDLENLNKEFTVIGINDYLFLEGYKKLKFEQEVNLRLPNLKLLPVVEFRIEKFAGVDFKKLKRINLHVIFSDEVTPETIQSQFLNTLEQSYSLTNGGKWTRAITPESVEELGKEIKATVPKDQLKYYKSDLTEGFNNLNVNEEMIFKSLEKDCFKGKYLIAIGKTEWNDLKWSNSSIATKKTIINKADLVFTASESIDAFEKAKSELRKQGVNDLLLDCSDAHTYSFKVDKDRIGNCNTWIKAEPTFEGLKQVLYESESRLKIQEDKPRNPLRKINSLKLNFPEKTSLQRKNSDILQPFCLNKIEDKIYFSPYFTCLIGGRGTGKSTIINLLAQRLGEKTDFFEENNLIIDEEEYDIELDIDNLINVDGTNEIEFVSQGKVENLAEGNELTRLIFNERIKKNERRFYDLDLEIKEILEIIDKTIENLFDLKASKNLKKKKEKEKETIKNIIDSVNDKRYQTITQNITKIRNEINGINNSNARYSKLIQGIQKLIIENERSEHENEIENRINEILSLVESLDEITIENKTVKLNPRSFTNSTQKLDALNTTYTSEVEALREFFQEKGMSEESIKDSQNANENLARVNLEITQIQRQIEKHIEIFKEHNKIINGLSELKDSYKELVNENLLEINNKLKINNENVLNINFSSEFNFDQFKETLFEEFYDIFSDFHIPGSSKSQVKEFLFLIEPNEELINSNYKKFIEQLEKIISNSRKSNNYIQIIQNIFSDKINFVIYKRLIIKHLYNLSQYIKIKGYYGDKLLENSSFGQRCTAVIVTLLMTGVKPLIIDEPEAHLDNRLVADYLVDLIKSKKLDRQIIFATHNSNFVINGDSELINILEIPTNEIFTNIVPTTIENISNREKLLKLEGGRDAFKIRERKYGIS